MSTDHPLERALERRQQRQALTQQLTWGGRAFDLLPLEEAAIPSQDGSSLESQKASPLLLVGEGLSQAARGVWESTPLQVRLALEAGILLPLGAVSLAKGLVAPDLDIKLLGIGWHRYFLLHSAVSVWALKEFYETYQAYAMSQPNQANYVKAVAAVAAAGGLGIALHLGIDATLQGHKSVVFGIPGLRMNTLVRGTLVDDNVWLLANSLWAFKMSKDITVMAFGEELQAVSDYVRRNFDGLRG